MDLKYKKWDDVPISVYKEIREVCDDDISTNVEKDLSILSILCDVSEEEIWGMKVSEINEMRTQLGFLNTFSFDKKNAVRKISINGVKCRIMSDIDEMTVSQYVDFQQYFVPKVWDKDIEKTLSVFIIPEGKKYAEGYDILEFQRLIADYLPITIAQNVCFFFLKKLLTCTNAFRFYSEYLIRKMKTKKMMKKNLPMYLKMAERQKEINSLLTSISSGFIVM